MRLNVTTKIQTNWFDQAGLDGNDEVAVSPFIEGSAGAKQKMESAVRLATAKMEKLLAPSQGIDVFQGTFINRATDKLLGYAVTLEASFYRDGFPRIGNEVQGELVFGPTGELARAEFYIGGREVDIDKAVKDYMQVTDGKGYGHLTRKS